MRDSSSRGAALFAVGVILIEFALVAAWADAPIRTPTWNEKLNKLTYGPSPNIFDQDDIGQPYTDRVAHSDSSYFFRYCRYGVLLDDDKPSKNGKLRFYYNDVAGETESEIKNNVFVLKKNFGSGGKAIAGGYIGWSRDYKPRFTFDWLADILGNLTMTVEPEKPKYFLFRYLHFNNELECFNPSKGSVVISQPDPSRKKLVVFIHGWNRIAADDPFESKEWIDLRTNWLKKLNDSGLDWYVVPYDWHVDAATGELNSNKSEIGPKVDLKAVNNASEAAEISHLHGQHLGELLVHLFPYLEKLHIIAHSAGTWAARSTAKHVLQSTNAEVQVTLLDPFMPYEGGSDFSCLGKAVIDQLDSSVNAERLYRLENYFSWDDDFAFGTQESFAWREGDISGLRVDFWDVLKTDFHVYGDHAGPIQFYADSLTDDGVQTSDGTDFSQYGWKKSMAYEELSSVGPTAAFSVDKTNGEAPLEDVQFTDLSTPGSSQITAWDWDFNNDGTVDNHDRNPKVTFQDPGEYDVKLTVFSASGSDEELKIGLITVASPQTPVVTAFQINDGAASTTSRTVTLNNVCTGNPTHYMASEFADFNGAAWQTYDTIPNLDLSAGNVVKTVYFKVKNESGESPVATDDILLDEPPLPDFSIRVSGGDSGVGWIKYDGSFNRTMNPFSTQYVILTVNTNVVISSLELRFGEAGSWGISGDGVRPLDQVPSGESTCFIVYGATDGELSLDNGSSWLGFAENNHAIIWPSPVSTARFRLWFPNRAQPSATSLSPYRHDPTLRRRLTISATAYFEGVNTPVTKSVVIPFRFLDSQQVP